MVKAGNEGIPDSIRNPFSLEADYANPKIYGWASVIFGALGILGGTIGAVVMWNPAPLILTSLGIIMMIAGYLLLTRAV